MTTHKLAVVSAGLGRPSSTRLLADRLAAATQESLREQGAASSVDVIELRDHAHDLTNMMLAGVPTGSLGAAIETVVGADGLIAVSPIFTASYSGLFKMFFDVLEPESLLDKPVLIGATGGTPRHSLALEHAIRPMFSYMRTVVVPTAVYAASQDWGTGGSDGQALTDRIIRASDQFAALVSGLNRSAPSDPYEDPVPFSDLLAGS